MCPYMVRAGDPVIRKADLHSIRESRKEDCIQSVVMEIAMEVVSAAEHDKTHIRFLYSMTEPQGKWVRVHYTPTPEELRPRVCAKFPDSLVQFYESDGRAYVCVDWS